MPVKYWSSAGLILTDWCNAACASCYLCCGAGRNTWMPVEMAVGLWCGLERLSPHGCRLHLTGGEPFGDWSRLIEIARRAQAEGLSPPDKVETNAFWATGEAVIRQRVTALDEAGMRTLSISADPFHQQFVPIERARFLARAAEDLLGARRLQVRWRDWLENGFDTDSLSPSARSDTFTEWSGRGRDRLNGRAAELLAPFLPPRPVEAFNGDSCRQGLLRSKHVHVGPEGHVVPGVCAGIVLGRVTPPYEESIQEIWRRLGADHAGRGIVGTLVEGGPAALAGVAQGEGFIPAKGYASKCHLCWAVRRFLVDTRKTCDELGPGWVYGSAGGKPGSEPEEGQNAD